MHKSNLDINFYREKYDIKPNNSFTDLDIDKIEKMYHNDMLADQQISAIYNCERSRIQRFRLKHGIATIDRETNLQKTLTKDILIDLYINQHMTDDEIAKKFNCARTTIRKYRIKYKIETLDKSIAKSKALTKELLFDMYANKQMTEEQIANEFDCTKAAIHLYRMKYGIKTNDRRDDVQKQLTKEILVDLYVNKQMTDKEIAEQFNYRSGAIIYKQRMRYGIATLDRKTHIQQNLTKEVLIDLYVNKKMTDKQIADELHCVTSTVQRYRQIYQIKTLPKVVSAIQQEVYAEVCKIFIDMNKALPEIIINDKDTLDGIEIDIFIPEHNFGIEFNGGYWHSEAKCNKKYHYNKSALAYEKGIFIYHIFSYEWEDKAKRLKILNQIQNLLGLNATKIYARKCEIREVAPKEKSSFLNANHVQGNDRSIIKLGLYYNDELVSLMTFAKPRFSNKYTWELSRFCSKAGCNIIGGASKLFKYFIDNYMNLNETIISYSDIAKTKGNLYANLGFTFVHISEPNYIWWKNDKEYKTRYQCQMKNENQIMSDQKYYRIYDCGNKVWIYTK